MPIDVSEWMSVMEQNDSVWYIKRLSGNDTLANGTHQAGPYIPKDFLFDVLSGLNKPKVENPDQWFEMYVDSHGENKEVRAIWYNNKLRGGTRNEARITQWGGASSALLAPDNTGALVIFAFLLKTNGKLESCHVWVCTSETEENLVEDKVGPVDPGNWSVWRSKRDGNQNINITQKSTVSHKSCWLCKEEIPLDWINKFPSGTEIIEKTIKLRPEKGISVDKRLMIRRECEYEIFRSIEESIELPIIQKGFSSVDNFIAKAQTVLQRRKARAGRSLELHTRAIFIEEGMKEDVNFSYVCESEPDKKPDFLFPSGQAYKQKSYPANKLRMLAVKTTCKDRWRQILNEADRIKVKHLFTLQEGISETQFHEMSQAGVKLVVPEPVIPQYSKKIRPELLTLKSFIAGVKALSI
jgi:hypothetical protein